MRCTLAVAISVGLCSLGVEASRAQQDGKNDGRPREPAPHARADDPPELEITPNTIRIQALDSPRKGSWVIMPGFSELGSPCFSSDGKWIAFDGYKQGFNNSVAESWIARPDGRDLTRLAMGATPRWSPDGKQLLFVREKVNNPKWEDGMFVINRDGSNERRIGVGRWPDWSPDGKQVVFSVGGGETGGARIGSTVFVSRLDGTDRRQIVDGDCPSWSPDGKKISFCLCLPERPPVICVHDLQTQRDLSVGIGWFRANWTADSKSVVCNGAIDRREAMVRYSLDDPWQPVELGAEYQQSNSPCCSRDGTQLIFIAKKPKAGTP